MAGRKTSARRLSMSQAAKKHLKEKKRKERLGILNNPAETKPAISRKTVRVLVIATLVVMFVLVVFVVVLNI